jgi:hypothetical protein
MDDAQRPIILTRDIMDILKTKKLCMKDINAVQAIYGRATHNPTEVKGELKIKNV